MDAPQLVELLQRIVRRVGCPDADVLTAIKKEVSELGFSPWQSRERSKALQGITRSSKTTSTMLTSNEFFWKALHPWATSNVSSLVMLEGALSQRARMQQIAIETTYLIGARQVPLAWALNVPPKHNSEEEPKFYNSQDVLAQICLQLLQQNSRLHQKSGLDELLSRAKSSISDSDWFATLLFCIDGLDQVFFVVDLDSVGHQTPETLSWPSAFTSLFQRLSQSTVKIILLTCQSSAIPSEDSPHMKIVRFPRTSDANVRHKRLARSARPNSEPAATIITDSWLQYIGIPRRKRPRPASEGESEHGEGAVATTSGSERKKSRISWFDFWADFDTAVEASRKDEPSSQFPRVKIAIFDTGVDISHPDIAEAVRLGRLKYRDFITSDIDMQDKDGHGTHCTSLLLKYAPNAEVYIGRVFEKSHVRSSRLATLADAVQYAHEHWHVDIISISLGFSESNEESERKFEEAVGRRILIFASASNNTVHGTKPIRFPADQSQVFCIYAADKDGHPSKFNPDASYESPNFMFPGEDVLGAWPADRVDGKANVETIDGKTYRRLSGTSCATPIAAATAAGVLEFAWQPRNPPIRRMDLLKKYDGMKSVFLKMAAQYKPGENMYHRVKPWNLISADRDNALNQGALNSILDGLVQGR